MRVGPGSRMMIGVVLCVALMACTGTSTSQPATVAAGGTSTPAESIHLITSEDHVGLSVKDMVLVRITQGKWVYIPRDQWAR